jgi:precorrin-6Y C5,15-methyltransferase (decarboxylating)
MVVLEQLGGEAERVIERTAEQWGSAHVDPLHLVALECRLEDGAMALSHTPGLPDEAYESDGQLTKRHVRAITLAALGPLPGRLLWDVGAGSGSIGIEWLRAEPRARAAAVEQDVSRAERARANALALGVPELQVIAGRAPEALAGLPPEPDAVFIGGGLTVDGVLELCWTALAPGGVAVANAVTLEGERVLTDACETHGGHLTRIEIAVAEPVGSLTGWRARMPVVQWAARKGSA